MQKIIRHELVEVVIPKGSTNTRYLIPDLPNLRNVHIFGLQVWFGKFGNSDPAVTPAFLVEKGIQTQFNVLPSDKVRNAFLTLVNYGGKEFLKQAPANMFQTQMGGLPQGAISPLEWNAKTFVGQKVNYPKSYIEFTTPPADAVNDQCFMFSVYYSLPIADEKKESGFSFSKKG